MESGLMKRSLRWQPQTPRTGFVPTRSVRSTRPAGFSADNTRLASFTATRPPGFSTEYSENFEDFTQTHGYHQTQDLRRSHNDFSRSKGFRPSSLNKKSLFYSVEEPRSRSGENNRTRNDNSTYYSKGHPIEDDYGRQMPLQTRGTNTDNGFDPAGGQDFQRSQSMQRHKHDYEDGTMHKMTQTAEIRRKGTQTVKEDAIKSKSVKHMTAGSIGLGSSQYRVERLAPTNAELLARKYWSYIDQNTFHADKGSRKRFVVPGGSDVIYRIKMVVSNWAEDEAGEGAKLILMRKNEEEIYRKSLNWPTRGKPPVDAMYHKNNSISDAKSVVVYFEPRNGPDPYYIAFEESSSGEYSYLIRKTSADIREITVTKIDLKRKREGALKFRQSSGDPTRWRLDRHANSVQLLVYRIQLLGAEGTKFQCSPVYVTLIGEDREGSRTESEEVRLVVGSSKSDSEATASATLHSTDLGSIVSVYVRPEPVRDTATYIPASTKILVETYRTDKDGHVDSSHLVVSKFASQSRRDIGKSGALLGRISYSHGNDDQMSYYQFNVNVSGLYKAKYKRKGEVEEVWLSLHGSNRPGSPPLQTIRLSDTTSKSETLLKNQGQHNWTKKVLLKTVHVANTNFVEIKLIPSVTADRAAYQGAKFQIKDSSEKEFKFEGISVDAEDKVPTMSLWFGKTQLNAKTQTY